MVKMRPGGRGRRQYQQKQKLARQKIKATNAAAVEAAGTGRSLMSHTPNTKYKTVNWITNRKSPSYKPQAASVKPENLHAANTLSFKRQAQKASSHKRQAPSKKVQASSRKRQAP